MSYFQDLSEKAQAPSPMPKLERIPEEHSGKTFVSSISFFLEKLIPDPNDKFKNMKPTVGLTMSVPKPLSKPDLENLHLRLRKEVNLLLAEAEQECIKQMMQDDKHEMIAKAKTEPPPQISSSYNDDF